MTVQLYCYNFNNYYNRIIKKYDTLADYGNYVYAEEDVNFNFSDGVNTSQVINTELNPDYIILTDTQGNINSRWFVIDADYQRNGQHIFTLHRDVIADNLENVLDADVFIEKAILNDDNPLIYNSEDFDVNQIKTKETLLKDKTDVAWICGYIARKDFNADTSADISIKANVIPDLRCEDDEGNLKPIAQYDYTEGQNIYWPYDEDLIIQYNGRGTVGQRIVTTGKAIKLTNSGWISTEVNGSLGYNADFGYTASSVVSSLNTLDISQLQNNKIKYSDYYDLFDSEDFIFINTQRDKIIEASDGYYRISSSVEYPEKTYAIKTNVQGDYIYTALVNKYPASPSSTNGAAFLKEKVYKYTVHMTRIQTGDFNIKMPNPEYRYQLKDAPYDMFCIPCPIDKSSVTIKNSAVEDWEDIELSKDSAIQFGQGLAASLGSFLYDLQLLPYCPLSIDVEENGALDINNNDTAAEGQTNWPLRYTLINTTANPEPKGIILWSLASQGTTNITSIDDIEVENVKLENQCDKYRIVSGNYGSSFDINIAKNKGLKNFTVDYTYLPYNPYIHVNPEFEELYGRDFDDCRGLIDQSDKSISYLSDAWTQYQINNKTYQQQFDRQIQNMELKNNVQKAGDIFNAVVGTAQGAVSGAAAGGIVGGIVGGVASAIGGVADIGVNQLLRNEALDYTKDMFGYQLQNIQALPQSIAKMTAYSKNNKVFPILEYYSCKNEEKRAFANKIAFNSMTVMVIGHLRDYINNTWSYQDIESKGYVKGKLIRLELDGEDFHMINSISAELDKGVYIK